MARKLLKTGCFFLIAFFILPLLTGCEELAVEQKVKEGETEIGLAPRVPEVPLGNAEGAVCDPFGGGSVGRDQGLTAELFHLPSSLPRYEEVSSYLSNGTKLDATLYFNQVNVPTRPFDAGFTTLEGETLKTPNGDTLYEWFAIRFQSTVKLTNNDRPGKVQFALLADDGAIMKGKVDGQWRTIVDNDGTHATRFAISRTPVEMTAASELPIELQYYQGPRLHIAAVVLWREWPEGNNAWKDSLDGSAGNELFFDSTKTPSRPQQAYKDLLARGWKPVPAENFFLPNQAPANPCPPPAEPEDPTEPTDPNGPVDPNEPVEETPDPSTVEFAVFGFDGTTTTTTANFIWQTIGVPSTTKIYWGTSETNLTQQANLGGAKVTTHGIQVTGLDPATDYYFRAESTDDYGRTVQSVVIRKATK